MRTIDRAIADGVSRLVDERYNGDVSAIARSRDLCEVLEYARESLVAQRFDLAHPISKSRWRARLRIAGARAAKRLPL